MKKVIAVLLLIAILAGIVSIFYFLNKPSREMSKQEKESAVAKILGRKPNFTAKDAPAGDAEFKGKYISFMYPAVATIRKQLLNGEELPYTGLELFLFSIESPKLSFSAEVLEAPKNVASLNDYPSVRLRQIQANLYDQKDVFVGNTKGLAFDKQSQTGFEKTGFFFLNNRIYSFSIQGSDSKAAGELFNKIIASLKFL